MNVFYFKADPETYAQIQPAIDDAFRVDWIETGKCEYILPPVEEIPVRRDGLCYLAIPGWMLDEVGADIFRNWAGVEEITEGEFLEAIAERAGE